MAPTPQQQARDARKMALFAYIGTIALDPRMRQAFGPPLQARAIADAVWACMQEDFPGVLEELAKNGARVVLQRAQPFVDSFIGDLFGRINSFVDTYTRPPRRRP